MNIGVDFDGVIIDSEKEFRYLFEKYAFLEYGRDVESRKTRRVQECFDLPGDDIDNIFLKHLAPITLSCPFMLGVGEVLRLLKKRGHKLYLVTARNDRLCGNEITSAKERLKELGFKFDGEFFSISDKAAFCKKNNIQVMIDDCNRNCRSLMETGIHTLYFRHKGVEKLPEGEYLVDVHNWMHIYKEICKLEKKVVGD